MAKLALCQGIRFWAAALRKHRAADKTYEDDAWPFHSLMFHKGERRHQEYKSRADTTAP